MVRGVLMGFGVGVWGTLLVLALFVEREDKTNGEGGLKRVWPRWTVCSGNENIPY